MGLARCGAREHVQPYPADHTQAINIVLNYYFTCSHPALFDDLIEYPLDCGLLSPRLGLCALHPVSKGRDG